MAAGSPARARRRISVNDLREGSDIDPLDGKGPEANPGASYPAAGERERFARLAQLFDQARGLGPAEREVLLATLHREDADVARDLQELLRGHDAGATQGAPELELLALPLDPTLAGRPAEEPALLHERIGQYRPVRLLGSGGMGRVYLAERVTGDFAQSVAIKLMRADLGDTELLRRFRAERHILAGLRHPHIASLLDGGATEDGRPYVVMEYVAGDDLLTHCEQRQLSIRQRLLLFLKVCAAVEHAHRNLVVHRDLKPANIQVTAEGEPKLLDFGIAKLLDPERGTDVVGLTRTGAAPMTPEYASPEQVRGEPVSTATDVYSLGAVLYELLCGQRAQPLTTRLPAEIERVVCQSEPALPSDAVLRAAAPPRTGLTALRTSRALAGDLDTIALTALHKDPARRYQTVAALADDLRRHLAGMPVTARRDTWTYRTRKFVARHRLGVGAAAALFVLALGSAIVMAVQAIRLAEQRDVARRETALTREIADFMVGLFEMAQPDAARAEQVRARALLDRGRQRIDEKLATAPEVRAGLMLAMGRAYTALGLYHEADQLLTDTGRRQQQDGGEAPAEYLRALGMLRGRQGRFQEAEETLRRALELELRAGARGGLAIGRTALAWLLNEAGRPVEALEPLRQARSTLVALHGPRHPEIVRNLLLEAGTLTDLGDFDAAEQALDAGVAMGSTLTGGETSRDVTIHRLRGHLAKVRGNAAEALAHFEKALELQRQVLDETHPDIDTGLQMLAACAEDLGDLERAESILRELVGRDRRQPKEHPYFAIDVGQLAAVLSRSGKREEAELLFEEALALQKRLLPPEHPEVATLLGNHGSHLNRYGETAAAAERFRAALAIRTKVLPPDHPALLTSLSQTAVAEHSAGRLSEAEELHRKVLAARRRVFGPGQEVAAALLNLAYTRRRRGDDTEAEQLLRESVDLYVAALPADHLDLARARLGLGSLLNDTSRPAEAEPLLRAAANARARALPPENLEVLQSRRELGRCLRSAGQAAEAETILRDTLSVALAEHGRQHPETRRCAELLAGLLESTQRAEAAEAIRASVR